MSLINRGIKNSSYLLISRIFLIVLGLFSSILLTRNLSLATFGAVVTVFTYVNLFTYLSFNGISTYVMRQGAKSIDKLPSLIDKTSGVKLFFVIFAQIICVAFLPITSFSLNIKLLIILYSFYLIFNSLLSHWIIVFDVYEKFQYRAILNILPQFLYFLSGIYIVFFIVDENLQIILLVLSNLLSFAITLLFCYKYSQKIVRFKTSFSKLFFDKKIIIGGAYFFIITLAGLLFAKVDVFMVSLLGSQEEVALYSVANRLTRQLSEIRTVMYAGFFPVLIKRASVSSIDKNKVFKTTFYFFFIVVVIALIVSNFSEIIFITIYGDKYAYSGYLFSLLCFFLAIDYSIQPYVMLLTASGNEKIVAIIFSILSITNILTNVVFYGYWELKGIVYSTLLTYSIFAIMIIFIAIPILTKNKVIS